MDFLVTVICQKTNSIHSIPVSKIEDLIFLLDGGKYEVIQVIRVQDYASALVA